MKLNTAPAPIHTHEGGRAQRINPELQLRRSVMSCMLWENTFYEDGQSIADRIVEGVKAVKPNVAAAIAREARTEMHLRHVPLLIARTMAQIDSHKSEVASLLAYIIQRPDELCEFLAIYWKDKKQPLSAQVKKGLAAAFCLFDAYQLAKYNRDGAIKLKDVLFLCHAKPRDEAQKELWGKLIDGSLPVPDTWEVALSSGADKKASWERLISENKLGGMAILRNLRNMEQAGVNSQQMANAISEGKFRNVLPFRFISAAKHAPRLEPQLEQAMFRSLSGMPKLKGHTVLLVDVSQSMSASISSKSDMARFDAAYGLAMLLREVCEEVSIYSFSMALKLIPPRRGFALRDAIDVSQQHSGTPLGEAVKAIYGRGHISSANFGPYGKHPIDYPGQGLSPDRLIVITDEQASGPVPNPSHGKGYMVNVATNKNGVGYGAWTHIDGWSESIVRYIQELESVLG